MTMPFPTRAARADDAAAITQLHAKALGPGRYARSAYRVREGSPAVSKYCRLALEGERIIAALRMTEVTIGGKGAALLLGPLAVDPDFKDRGAGRQLVRELLDQATAAGLNLVVLVGDESYYGRFGFKPVPAGQINFPGPVNPARILGLELRPGILAGYRGLVAAAS